jgi:hypothetical protein
MSTQAINQSIYLPNDPRVSADIVNKHYVDSKLSRGNFCRVVETFTSTVGPMPASTNTPLQFNTTYNLSDYAAVQITLNGSNANVGTITVVFTAPGGLVQSLTYTAPGNAPGVSVGQGKDMTIVSWFANTVNYSYGSVNYRTNTTPVQTTTLPFIGIPGAQFVIFASGGLPDDTNTGIKALSYTGTNNSSGYLSLLDNAYIANGQNYIPNLWWGQVNSFGAPNINSPVTSVFRQFNNTELFSATTGNEGFAILNKGDTSGGFSTITLKPGIYQITAGGVMLQANTHCVGLVDLIGGLANPIIATGTICHSTNTDLGSSNASIVTARYNTSQSGAKLGLLHAFTAHSANLGTVSAPNYICASLGRPLQNTPVINTIQEPSWIPTYIPYVTTAWVDIEKIS